MKCYRLVASMAMVCLLLLATACESGGSKEAVIGRPAGEMNFTEADLGAGWTLQSDQGLDQLPAFEQSHIRDASMRMFGKTEVTGMMIGVVIATNTLSSAQKEMQSDAVKNFGADVAQQLAGLDLKTLDPPSIGDEAAMVGGTHADLGLGVYLLTFRKANVIALFSLIGSQDLVNEKLALEYGRKLESKMQ